MDITRREFTQTDKSEEMYDTQTGHCGIEYYVAGFDIYRITDWGNVPMPWMYTMSGSSSETQEIVAATTTKINAILEKYAIVPDRMTTKRVLPQAYYCACETLLIDCTATFDEMNWDWKSAAHEIQEAIDTEILARDLENTGITVEIRDPERMVNYYPSVIRFNSPAHHFFKSIESRVTELVREHCPVSRVVISYRNQGRRGQTKNLMPTIHVVIAERSRYSWDASYKAILKAVDELRPADGPVFNLEFMPGH